MANALRLALTIIGHLPLPLLHGLGWLLAVPLIYLPNRLRRISQLHVDRCLPDLTRAQRKAIVERSLLHSMLAIVEAPSIWFGPISRRRHWITADSAVLQQVRDLHAAGRGVILLTPHQGAWELSSYYCAALAPITVLYKPQKGFADAVIREGRMRAAPITPVPTTSAGVKALLSALRRGELVGILPDHDPPDGSGTVFAPLFGIPANTMDLVSKLAARSKAPVYFFIAERLNCGRGFRFHLLPAPSDIADPDVGPAALNKGVEQCIRRLPDQYWWSYRRFRRRPQDEAPFYPPDC